MVGNRGGFSTPPPPSLSPFLTVVPGPTPAQVLDPLRGRREVHALSKQMGIYRVCRYSLLSEDYNCDASEIALIEQKT